MIHASTASVRRSRKRRIVVRRPDYDADRLGARTVRTAVDRVRVGIAAPASPSSRETGYEPVGLLTLRAFGFFVIGDHT